MQIYSSACLADLCKYSHALIEKVANSKDIPEMISANSLIEKNHI